MKAIKIVTQSILVLLVVLIMALSIRGTYGNPTAAELREPHWKGGGVFEVSPERGRYGLLYSLVEDRSFYFSVDVARFILPDLGYKDGHYVSLFAPAVSFLSVPGYLIGKYFGASQVGAFSTSAFFGLLNFYLIYLIINNITRNKIAGVISGIVFLFATPAFSYAVNLYQHHISTFLILFSLYQLVSFQGYRSLAIIFFLCAMSIPVDYPNLILMAPIGIAAFMKLFNTKNSRKKVELNFNWVNSTSILIILIPLLFFMWFNFKSYNNPLQFSGTVGGVHEIDEYGNPTTPKDAPLEKVESYIDPDKQNKSATRFFKTRNLINGLYIHSVSPDRGILIFAPVILFGLYGFYLMYIKKEPILPVLFGVTGATLLLYSMWGDPWGGWSFGSRYLIPAYALLAIAIGYALSVVNKKLILVLILYPVALFSVYVNTLGAITSSANPPKIEAVELERLSNRNEPYSFDRNWNYLNEFGSKSFVYKTWLSTRITPVTYFYILFGIITMFYTSLNIAIIFDSKKSR